MRHTLRDIPNGWEVSYFDGEEQTAYMQFLVTYVEPMSWGVMATVEVRTNIKSAMRLPNNVLLMDRFNLMRSMDREKVGRRIDFLAPPPEGGGRMDWQHHLEHLAVVINNELIRPVPFTDLDSHPMPSPQRFLIPGLLALNKTNSLYGAGGTGKSFFCVRIAGSVTTGMDLLGMKTQAQGHVLYLDWEDDADTMVERVEQVSMGMGLNQRFPLLYKSLRGRGPYERHHADIRLEVKNRNVRLVIVDSTAMAMHGGSAGEGAEAAIKFFDLMSQLETTVLLIDHLSSDDVKSGEGSPKPYGSVFKVNAVRNMWEASRTNDGLVLRHRKSNVGPKHGDLWVDIGWQPGVVTFDEGQPA